jgi:integrase
MGQNLAINFTQARLTAMSASAKGRISLRDIKVNGLTFVVTSRDSRSFYLVKRIRGVPARIRIGAWSDITVEKARQIAVEYLGKIAVGEEPRQDKNAHKTVPTLTTLFEHWLETYAKIQKRTWKEDVRMFNKYCNSIKKKHLNELNKMNITEWHRKIGNKHGHCQSNKVIKLIRSLFRVSDELGYTNSNPCTDIRMFPEKERKRFLLPTELEAFRLAVMQEKPVWRDLFLMLLFTGQRKSNVCQMRWADVDLQNKLWYVTGTQFKNNKPQAIVLSENACEILQRRYNDPQKNETWVFTHDSRNQHVGCPACAWERILKRSKITGLHIHDLRRTFGSWQAIMGTSLPIIGKSLGHVSTKSTEIYARLITDPVRESVEKATQKIVELWDNKNNQQEKD